jgi:hypothetical protein
MSTGADWYQAVLTPPEVLELNLRLGFVPETDHVQALLELKDPVTGVLTAQASVPHERLANWPALWDWARSRADEWITEALEPF